MAEKILDLVKDFDTKAVIFDLDGTILDNNPFHLKAWKQYLEQVGKEMTDEEFNKNINGRTNRDVVKYLYGDHLQDHEIEQHTNQKEALYREMYTPHIEPVPGLLDLLKKLHQQNIPMAIATSGIQDNINFMFEHVDIKKYFPTVVDSSYITHGKPNPEIFLKTAELLNVDPSNCLVFEDAVVGVKSAKAAGMKVVAVLTTEVPEHLTLADIVINDYRDII